MAVFLVPATASMIFHLFLNTELCFGPLVLLGCLEDHILIWILSSMMPCQASGINLAIVDLPSIKLDCRKVKVSLIVR